MKLTKKLSVVVAVLIAVFGFSQQEHENLSNKVSDHSKVNKIYQNGVDEKAQYPGGNDKFKIYFAQKFNNDKLDGLKKVTSSKLSFIIEKDGSISNIEAIGESDILNKEIIRTLQSMNKKWSPAIKNGKPVRFRYIMPITMSPPKF